MIQSDTFKIYHKPIGLLDWTKSPDFKTFLLGHGYVLHRTAGPKPAWQHADMDAWHEIQHALWAHQDDWVMLESSLYGEERHLNGLRKMGSTVFVRKSLIKDVKYDLASSGLCVTYRRSANQKQTDIVWVDHITHRNAVMFIGAAGHTLRTLPSMLSLKAA